MLRQEILEGQWLSRFSIELTYDIPQIAKTGLKPIKGTLLNLIGVTVDLMEIYLHYLSLFVSNLS